MKQKRSIKGKLIVFMLPLIILVFGSVFWVTAYSST